MSFQFFTVMISGSAFFIFSNDVFLFLICLVFGWFFGLLTGLIPGIHVNNIAVILASAASFLYGFGFSPVSLSVIILACAVSHTFHNIIPAVFLGAPGEETVFAVLPGHRLLLAGEGFSAVRLSALGSIGAVFISLPLMLPTAFFLYKFYPFLETQMGWLLVLISFIVLFSEKKIPLILSAFFVFLVAGFLGLLAFELDGQMNPLFSFSSASVLMPLLGGLFGVPSLIISLFSNSEIPLVQKKSKRFPFPLLLKNVFLGTAAGAFVSWIPGVSSSVAAIFTTFFKREDSDHEYGDLHRLSPSESQDVELNGAKEFIISVSAINTANAIFGLLAFFVIGKSRNGAVVSISDILSGSGLSVSGALFSGEAGELFYLFFAVIIACGFLSYFSTVSVGDFVPILFQKINYRFISVSVLFVLSALILLLCGFGGFLLFVAASLIGFLPVLLHVRKSNLMGVILFPVMLYFLGLR